MNWTNQASYIEPFEGETSEENVAYNRQVTNNSNRISGLLSRISALENEIPKFQLKDNKIEKGIIHIVVAILIMFLLFANMNLSRPLRWFFYLIGFVSIVWIMSRGILILIGEEPLYKHVAEQSTNLYNQASDSASKFI